MKSVAIAQNLHHAILVRSVNECASALQPVEKIGAGMAVGFFFTRRNNGDLRSNRGKKFWHGGVFAAVMADLQNIGVQERRIVLR